MRIAVRPSKSDRQPFEVDVALDDTVTDLKKTIAELYPEFPVASQMLLFNGKSLQEVLTLEQVGIKPGGFVVMMNFAPKRARPRCPEPDVVAPTTVKTAQSIPADASNGLVHGYPADQSPAVGIESCESLPTANMDRNPSSMNHMDHIKKEEAGTSTLPQAKVSTQISNQCRESATASCDAARLDFEQLESDPCFHDLAQLLTSKSYLLDEMINALNQHHPQWATFISRNREEFMCHIKLYMQCKQSPVATMLSSGLAATAKESCITARSAEASSTSGLDDRSVKLQANGSCMGNHQDAASTAATHLEQQVPVDQRKTPAESYAANQEERRMHTKQGGRHEDDDPMSLFNELLSDVQFSELAHAIAQDPNAITQIAGVLLDFFPALAQAILDNPKGFWQLARDSLAATPKVERGRTFMSHSSASTFSDEDSLSGTRVSSSDEAAVHRLASLGVPIETARKAYMLCNRNEDQAAAHLYRVTGADDSVRRNS